MSKYFRRNVRVTSVFFFVRFVFALVISLLYILIAAAVQYYFVKLLGESTFNYIVGGLLSLFFGVMFCHYIGSLAFMFAKGWHVAALAYVPKIVKSRAPAFDVGVRAFSKNLISFGAVYGVRALLTSTVTGFKTKLWDIADDIPYVALLKRFAEHPIVEYIASDVLHYGFDAAIYYLVRFPPEDVNEVPSTVLTAIKKYLYCIPSILLSSVQSYILFRFFPKMIKWIVIIWTFISQGFVAGILVIVLMVPVFYILENTFLDPLTMITFISAYAKQCDKEVDENSPIVQAVNSIIDGDDVGTTSDDFEDSMEEDEKSARSKKSPRKKEKGTVTEMPSDEELFGPSAVATSKPEPGDSPKEGGVPQSILGAVASLAQQVDSSTPVQRTIQPSFEDLPLEGEDTSSTSPIPDASEEEDFMPPRIGLSDLFRAVNGGDLNSDPLAGLYGEPDDGGQPKDRAQSLLSGDEE